MVYYGYYPYNSTYYQPTQPLNPYSKTGDQYTYPQNYPMALQLILEALSGETEDKLFYDYLISIAPSQEDKDIIASIRDDEKEHFDLFRQLYYELTGQMPPQQNNEGFTKPASYCQGIKKSILGEISAVENYRKILFAMVDRRHINILTRIITDEIRHADFFNFLYSKNKCHMEESTGGDKKY